MNTRAKTLPTQKKKTKKNDLATKGKEKVSFYHGRTTYN